MCPRFRRLIRYSIPLVLIVAGAPDTDAGQQVSRSREQERLSVVGKVIDAATSQPIVGATVTFTALPARQATRPMSAVSARGSTRTDGTGAFSVAASNTIGLRIAAAADGYIPGAYGQMWPNGPDVVLGRNAIVNRDVVVRLWKYASLSGTIVRSDGNPIEGVTVSLFTHSPMRLARSAVTDRAGRYRMEGLASGTYIVGVLPSYNTWPHALTEQVVPGSGIALDLASELARSGAPHPVADGIRQGEFVVQIPRGFPPAEREGTLATYRSVFYDRADMPSAAFPILLRPGEARDHVDLDLQSANAIAVSGRVSGPQGYVPNLAVHLVYSDSDTNVSDDTIFVASTVTDANGFFTILGVGPGRYELRVWQRPGPIDRTNLAPHIPGRPANDSRPLLWATMPVLVETTDVHNIEVNLTNGPVLRGNIEQEGPRDATARSQFPIALVLNSVDRRTAPIPITVFPDRTFTAGVIAPGSYYLSTPSSDEWLLASARTSGGDLSKEAVTLTSGDYQVDVRAVRRNSTLVVDLTAPDTTAPEGGATVLVFPSKERPIASDDLFRVVLVTREAMRARETLPPGEYLAIALSAAAFDLDWRDSEIIDRLTPHATRVVVRNGENAHVTLRPIDFK